jgi:hypothetical protein
MEFETLVFRREGDVLFAEIAAPPMDLLGPELVRDLVTLIQVEVDPTIQGRNQEAMNRELQTREAEVDLARMLANLTAVDPKEGTP